MNKLVNSYIKFISQNNIFQDYKVIDSFKDSKYEDIIKQLVQRRGKCENEMLTELKNISVVLKSLLTNNDKQQGGDQEKGNKDEDKKCKFMKWVLFILLAVFVILLISVIVVCIDRKRDRNRCVDNYCGGIGRC